MNKTQTTSATTLFLLIAMSWLGAQSSAQDKQEDFGIFETQQQYFDFMGSVKEAGATNPELRSMVSMINDIVLLQPFGSTSQKYGTANDTLGLLADESVRKELEMVDSQFEEIKAANDEIQMQFAKRLRELDLSDMDSAAKQILALRSESENELQATLLPHQMKRLRQLAARNQLRQRSLIDIITSEPLQAQLNISQDQAKELKAQEKKVQEDLQRQITELRVKAHKRLLSSLKSDQRKQVEEIFGSETENLLKPANKSRLKK